ncbi:MAG: putative coproporphyrinogen [Candidatus Brocadia sinica]|nr:MAG: putative coproporphyrinogen [Candidatus Brocadia sinica]MCK6469463.1 radical SAM family heme chaperone HemW [Candidatus Brocadia sinica]NUO06233.1 radical SAM family heme chaperone HemW [Candidatus Brocadia sinica]
MTVKRDALPHALYIHIPFCVKKCNYCDFNSIVSGTKIVDRYLHALEKELRALQGRYVFKTIYIGGGTPSILAETQLEKLLHSVVRYVPASEIQEYTVEVNPGTLTGNKVALLKAYFVNRISLGVQSFQDSQLKLLGRIHSGDDARNAFLLLRTSGFENINIDLIFGCPGQSSHDWEKDLRIAVELNPEHISTYSLTYEEGTPLTMDLENEVVHKLDESVELEMYKTAIRHLTSAGYNHYEISNFAKDRRECSHNQVYWKNTGYAGAGAGAFSFIDGRRTSNVRDVFQYMAGIHENKNVQSFGECLQPKQFASETVIMSLRLRQGISNTDFYKRFGYNLEEQFGTQINRLVKEGLISYEDERLKLTEKGLFIADTVMTEFV